MLNKEKLNANDVGGDTYSDTQKQNNYRPVGAGFVSAKNEGITLIALIITIIVMLILVGVTINVALNGGLFTRTQNAAAETEKYAILEEIIAMAKWNNNGEVNVEETKNLAMTKYTNSTWDGATGKLTITGKLGTYEYTISKTKIAIKKEDSGDIPEFLESYFYNKNILDPEAGVLEDPGEMKFTDERIKVDDGFSPEEPDEEGYMYVPIKFENKKYNLKIKVIDADNMIVELITEIASVELTGNAYKYYNSTYNMTAYAYNLGDDYILINYYGFAGAVYNKKRNDIQDLFSFSDDMNKLTLSFIDNEDTITLDRTNENFEYSPYLEDGIYKNAVYYCAETGGYFISFGEDVANFCTTGGKIYMDYIYIRYTDIGQTDRFTISDDARTITYNTTEFAGDYVLMDLSNY